MNDFSKYSDKELTELLTAGKPDSDFAFYEIFQRYGKKLNAYCRFNSNSQTLADEIFQETWIKFDKSIKDGNKIINVLAYLITISKNLIIYKSNRDNYRSNYLSEITNDELDNYSFDNDFQKKIENNELIELLKIAVMELDDNSREAFILKKFDDLTYPEISKITGESVDCLKKRVARSMLKIKKILKPYINELL